MQPLDLERGSLIQRIYDINERHFEGVALEVWKYQFRHNPLYQEYCRLLGVEEYAVEHFDQVPFLPVSMFRGHEIRTGSWATEAVFKSSGTTGQARSHHFICDLHWYHTISKKCFSIHFGDPARYIWLGLLPSYLERTDSSLVDMVHTFMGMGRHPDSRFFPEINNEIISVFEKLKAGNQPTILIGVSFAVLDLFEQFHVPVWPNLVVMETGGMKGRGTEITREELYMRLRRNHPDLVITSEYGMTELQSQAYKVKNYFQPGPTMKVRVRDISDPLKIMGHGQRGVINVIDLGNVDTCSFIATDDIGISYPDGGFDVLGRMDNSDLRGCNLMYTSA